MCKLWVLLFCYDEFRNARVLLYMLLYKHVNMHAHYLDINGVEFLEKLSYSYKILQEIKRQDSSSFLAEYELQGEKRLCHILYENAERNKKNYSLFRKLKGIISVPEVIEGVETADGFCLVTEWVDGKVLIESVHSVFQKMSWPKLSIRRKRLIVGYLVELVCIMNDLSGAGWVLEKFRPEVFAVKDDKLILVDLSGAMPVEDAVNLISDNVYVVGLLMLLFLTDYPPGKFDYKNEERLYDVLMYFVSDVEIAKLIIACLSPSTEKRPGFPEIKTSLDQFFVRLRKTGQGADVTFSAGLKPSVDLSTFLISTALVPVTSYGPFAEINSYNWKTGAAGIQYLVGRIDKLGFAAREFEVREAKSVNGPGLYEGLAGVAMALAANGFSGLENWFEPSVEAGIAKGAAGQGVALLHSLHSCDKDLAEKLLDSYLFYLLGDQSGGWSWLQDNSKPGFSDGVAGIAFFLWLCVDLYPQKNVANAAIQAMDWLSKCNTTSSPWFSEGMAGIAFCFMQAYKISGDEQYRERAENMLYGLSSDFRSAHLSFLNGMTGLGETYLEAWHVFKNEEWKERAHIIFNDLLHLNRQWDGGGYYWSMEGEVQPSAGLLNGNSGVLYFMMRYILGVDKVPHLFLPV